MMRFIPHQVCLKVVKLLECVREGEGEDLLLDGGYVAGEVERLRLDQITESGGGKSSILFCLARTLMEKENSLPLSHWQRGQLLPLLADNQLEVVVLVQLGPGLK